jgi:hypothetical protein
MDIAMKVGWMWWSSVVVVFVVTNAASVGDGRIGYLSLLLQELLPADWENDKWNGIYEQARYKMGVHMGDI